MAKHVEITKDRVNSVVRSITALVGKQVLVGIPMDTTTRKESAPITNAELGYIHEFGSPGANIPARPFLVPGVRKAVKDYTPHLRAACAAALDANQSKAEREMRAAGMIAEQSAKNEIRTGDFAPLSPATVASRRRSRDTTSRRDSEERYLDLVRTGVTPAAAQEATGIRPLINTGQLLSAITSVLRKAK